MYDTTFEAVRRFCLRRLTVSDANDAVAEVYLVAWRRADVIPPGEETLPWLYGVAHNVVRRIQRSNHRRFRLTARTMREPVETHPDPEVELIRHAEYQELAAAIKRLSSGDQEVIRLRAWEELPAPAIATVLDCSVSAAEKRITRAFHRLEKLIRPIDGLDARQVIVPEEGGR